MIETPPQPEYPAHLKRLRLGCRLILWTLVIQVVGLCAIMTIDLLSDDPRADWEPTPALIVLIATLATSCASLYGWWLLSAKDAAVSAKTHDGFSRLWVRYSILGVVLFAIAEEAFPRLAPAPGVDDFNTFAYIRLAFRALYIASIHSLLLAGATLLAHISTRVGAPRERKRFRRARLWLIITTAASAMIFTGPVLLALLDNPSVAGAFMLSGLPILIVSGLAALIYSLRGLVSLTRRLSALLQTQRNAEPA